MIHKDIIIFVKNYNGTMTLMYENEGAATYGYDYLYYNDKNDNVGYFPANKLLNFIESNRFPKKITEKDFINHKLLGKVSYYLDEYTPFVVKNVVSNDDNKVLQNFRNNKFCIWDK